MYTVTITINPTAEVDQPSSQVLCNSTSSSAVHFTTQNTGGTTSYTWTNSKPEIGLASGGTMDIASFTASNTTTVPIVATIVVTPTFANGSVDCSGPTKSFTITVNPTAQVNQSLNQVLCNGLSTNAVNFSTQNTGGTTSYTWSNSLPSIGLAVNGTGNIGTFTATNTTSSTVTATITVTPHFINGTVSCDGPTESFTITVNPTPTPIISGPTPVCASSENYYSTALVSGHSYQWVVSGGVIISGANSYMVKVKWNTNCISGWLTVTETNLTTLCTTTTSQFVVTINPLPTPSIAGDINVTTGSPTYTYSTSGSGNLYSWSVIGGTVLSGQGTSSIVVQWGCASCTTSIGTVTLIETTPQGCSAETSINVAITIGGGTHTLSGQLTYDNSNLALNGVNIQLMSSSGVVLATTTTSAFNSSGIAQGGSYEFTNLPDGNYTLNVSSTKPWGGVTATDALLIKRHTVGFAPLPDPSLQWNAADVNASSAINATDALIVQLRIVGLVNQFAAGNWKFNNHSITISGANYLYDFNGICVGDINRSYNTTYLKQLTAENDGVQEIAANTSFTYNIKSSATAELGAMTLFMNYDQSLFEIEKVNNTLSGMQYKIENGRIALAWADLQAVTVHSGETIISLQLRALRNIAQPTQIFNYHVSSEFADPNAVVLENVGLKMADVQTSSHPKGFDADVYPNPARNITNIVYTIPEQGSVKITLTNILGQAIQTLVDAEQSEGTYKVVLNAADWMLYSGVYMYQIEVNGVTTHYSKLGKIVFER